MPQPTKQTRARFDVRTDNGYVAFLGELRDTVSRAMRLDGISFDELGRLADVHPNTVRRFLDEKKLSPKLPTVYRILRGVGVSLLTNAPKPRRRRAARSKV